MKSSTEIIGIVKRGKVTVSERLPLPDGTRVRIIPELVEDHNEQPYDRQELSREDVLSDVAWATGKRFLE